MKRRRITHQRRSTAGRARGGKGRTSSSPTQIAKAGESEQPEVEMVAISGKGHQAATLAPFAPPMLSQQQAEEEVQTKPWIVQREAEEEMTQPMLVQAQEEEEIQQHS